MERRLNQPVADQNFRQGSPLRLLQRAGIDRAVGFTILGRGWNALAGLVTLLLMTRFLSPVEQGFYYTFSGFLGATILFELGLSFVILQFASHEWAKLEWTDAGILTGDPEAKTRLALMLQVSLRWYCVLALLIVATLLPAGLLFFRQHTPPGVSVSWQLPWIWISTVTAGTLALSPLLAALEGCGLVAEIAALRARQSVASSLLLWLFLCLHGGLYAAPLPGLVMMAFSGSWLWGRKRAFLRDILAYGKAAQADGNAVFRWRTEIWPFQWRIAFSGVSSYFIFQLFTPVLFATHGAVAAGQMGLSLSITGAIASLALSWLSTKSQPFGTLIAARNWAKLDGIFFPTLWRSWTVAALGGAVFWGTAWFFRHQGYPLSERLLPPLPLGLLTATTVLNHVVGAEALYLRAHKQEPFLALSVGTAALIALCDIVLVRPYGAVGMMLGYFVINLVGGLGVGTGIFITKRRQWHSAAG